MSYGYMIESDLWFEDEETADNFLMELENLPDTPFDHNSSIDITKTPTGKLIYWLDIHDAYGNFEVLGEWIPEVSKLGLKGEIVFKDDYGGVIKIEFLEDGFKIYEGEITYTEMDREFIEHLLKA